MLGVSHFLPHGLVGGISQDENKLKRGYQQSGSIDEL